MTGRQRACVGDETDRDSAWPTVGARRTSATAASRCQRPCPCQGEDGSHHGQPARDIVPATAPTASDPRARAVRRRSSGNARARSDGQEHRRAGHGGLREVPGARSEDDERDQRDRGHRPPPPRSPPAGEVCRRVGAEERQGGQQRQVVCNVGPRRVRTVLDEGTDPDPCHQHREREDASDRPCPAAVQDDDQCADDERQAGQRGHGLGPRAVGHALALLVGRDGAAQRPPRHTRRRNERCPSRAGPGRRT